jgi:uncharacterized protein with PIN domain
MRLFGFDTLYDQGFTSQQLVKISATRGRVLLTKSRRLLQNGFLTHRILVKGDDVELQLRKIFQRLDLYGDAQPFTRCMFCNRAVEPVSSVAVGHRRPARVQADKKELSQCASCQRIYWEGTHFDRMNRFVRKILKQSKERESVG